MSAAVSDKDLLAWILSQDRLRVERWFHPDGRQSVSVYTALDDEDEPSGRAPTARAALVQAYRQWWRLKLAETPD